jgi:divalent metal cation (Fe/Co/Zn/Cd) transporter
MSQPAVPEVTGPAARRAVRYEQATIAYNIAAGIIAISAGLTARSIALLGFGFDSWIEVAAATMVLGRLRAELRGGTVDEVKQRRALRFVAVTFFVLAAYLLVEGFRDLAIGATPEASPVGIALTAASIVVMPWLAARKRAAGLAMRSRLVVADAAETRLCAWLSISTFAGQLAYALLGWTWLDAAAGLVIAAFAVKEGREAWQGELVCNDDD